MGNSALYATGYAHLAIACETRLLSTRTLCNTGAEREGSVARMRRQSHGKYVRRDIHAAEEDSVPIWPVWAEGWSGRLWPEKSNATAR